MCSFFGKGCAKAKALWRQPQRFGVNLCKFSKVDPPLILVYAMDIELTFEDFFSEGCGKMHFGVSWCKFSKVSSPLNFIYKMTIVLNFERNFSEGDGKTWGAHQLSEFLKSRLYDHLF